MANNRSSSSFVPFAMTIVVIGISLFGSMNISGVQSQSTAESCDGLLATVTLFSNRSSISNVLGGRLLLRFNRTSANGGGFLNATNLDFTCTFPHCVFAANASDQFIRTDLYRNRTAVLSHGTILAVGPEVVLFPNRTRVLYFPDGSSRVEQCEMTKNGKNRCGWRKGGGRSSSSSSKRPVTDTIMFADGTQRFQMQGRPTISVSPNGTETTTFPNGFILRRQIQVPKNKVVALATQTLYLNGTQVFYIRGRPTLTICSNGVVVAGGGCKKEGSEGKESGDNSAFFFDD